MATPKKKTLTEKEMKSVIIDAIAEMDISLSIEEDCADILVFKYGMVEYSATIGTEIGYSNTDRLLALNDAMKKRGRSSIVTKIMFIGEVLHFLHGFASYKVKDPILKQCLNFFIIYSKRCPYYFTFNSMKPTQYHYFKLQRRGGWHDDIQYVSDIFKAIPVEARKWHSIYINSY